MPSYHAKRKFGEILQVDLIRAYSINKLKPTAAVALLTLRPWQCRSIQSRWCCASGSGGTPEFNFAATPKSTSRWLTSVVLCCYFIAVTSQLLHNRVPCCQLQGRTKVKT